MVAILRGTPASETLTANSPDGENLILGNGGDDRFVVAGTAERFAFANVVGNTGADTLTVDFGAGDFIAGAGNDTLDLRSGAYRYDGDAGSDTLVLGGPLSGFDVTSAGNGVLLASSAAAAQTADVETFRFADVTVNQGDGNLLVDDLFYLRQNPDVAAAGIDPEAHYAQFGRFEGRDPNIKFDVDGYLEAYADVRAAGVDPLEHYLTFGWREGRDPSGAFDTSGYLAANPDVAAAGVNPLLHYLTFGVVEARVFVSDGVFDA